MANIVKSIYAKLIEHRGSNKSFPCKVYKSEAGAEAVVEKACENIIKHFFIEPEKQREAGYLVFYIKEWDRWVAAINFSEVLSRKDCQGGYLGIESDFYKF